LVTYIIQEFGEVLLFSCLGTLGGQGIGNTKFIQLIIFGIIVDKRLDY
jgi:hypothetical protein